MSTASILDNARLLAISRGGECLSNKYLNNKTLLLWRCSKNHVWSANYQSVYNKKTWCPKCIKRSDLCLVRTEYLEKARKLANSRGGECLSNKYQNNKTPLLWRCSKNHKWFARYYNIDKGTWCPDCAKQKHCKKIVITLEKVHQLAARRGGKCLSDAYQNNKALLSWKCDKGHEWFMSYNSVNAGSWCPECVKVFKKRFLIRSGLEKACKLAIKKNGECLSTTYKNNRAPLLWKCDKGHEWFACYNNVSRNTWCPVCAKIHRRKWLPQTPSPYSAQFSAINRDKGCS